MEIKKIIPFLKKEFENYLLRKKFLKLGYLKQSSGKHIEGVVFSKDRPLQLNALLESYYFYCDNPVPLSLIYTASNSLYQKAYDEVIDLWRDRISIIAKESQPFKKELQACLKKIQANRIFFLVDDIVFLRKFSFEDVDHYNPDRQIFSLRLGEHIRFCYTLQKDEDLPLNFMVNTNGHYEWNWKLGVHDWGYPISVDGHIFNKNEFDQMVDLIEFKAPNTLEAKLQAFAPLFRKRKGVCFKRSVILNNPCNKVQTENDNIHGGLHQKELLKYWNKGLKIDISNLSIIQNSGVHEEIEFSFSKRILLTAGHGKSE